MQSVVYSNANGGVAGLFAAYAGPADQLAAVTFDLGITYGETDTLTTYPGAPGYTGTAMGVAGFATANGVGASVPFTPAAFSCQAGASSCGASLSTRLVYDVPAVSLAAFVGNDQIALFPRGSFGLSYDGGAPVTSRAASARIAGTVTYTLRSDVPEPASWAMMIGGLGAVGVALRTRPRKALRPA